MLVFDDCENNILTHTPTNYRYPTLTHTHTDICTSSRKNTTFKIYQESFCNSKTINYLIEWRPFEVMVIDVGNEHSDMSSKPWTRLFAFHIGLILYHIRN